MVADVRVRARKNHATLGIMGVSGSRVSKGRLMSELDAACRIRNRSMRDVRISESVSSLASFGYLSEAADAIRKIGDQYSAAKAIEQTAMCVSMSDIKPEHKRYHFFRLNFELVKVVDSNRRQDVKTVLALEIARAGFPHDAINKSLHLDDPYRKRSLMNIVHDLAGSGSISRVLEEMVEAGYEHNARELAQMIEGPKESKKIFAMLQRKAKSVASIRERRQAMLSIIEQDKDN